MSGLCSSSGCFDVAVTNGDHCRACLNDLSNAKQRYLELVVSPMVPAAYPCIDNVPGCTPHDPCVGCTEFRWHGDAA